MDINKIISANVTNFNEWDRQFVQYLEAQYEPENMLSPS
ncbi:hypothetical protein C8P68_1153 [Mucilaginibacter yixingensis]|uniref:Uncharacterized protein n=1 Tax=Mucilaginibacter yixingensis TaxID=1295612 RepID=A0A2T5J4B5_9SPHI|nr:hypothetical protein C8P68_1153 [Mucilaginibacter yixingensis]